MISNRSIGLKLLALLEGLGWLIAYQVAQGLALIALLVALLHAAFGTNWPEPERMMRLLLDLELDQSFLLIGTSALGSLFIIIPLVWLRLGRQARDYLQLTTLKRSHAVFALAMVVPVGVLGDALHQVAEPWWSQLMAESGLSEIWLQSSVHQLHKTFEGVPYYVLVVAVALGPAVGEELVFRGAIGRRMVAAWGVPLGILFTSILFGLAHVSPPHAIATIPIAIVAHLLYLHCKTIWAPILLHFGNNLLAVSAVRFDILTDAPVTTLQLLGAVAYLGVLVLAWNWNDRLLNSHSSPTAA